MQGSEPRSVGGGASKRRAVSDRVLELATDRLRIVAEPTRVRIMKCLESLGGATVQQVCDALGGESHQNVSKHLRTLYAAGLVARRRSGNSVRYELADWAALWIVDKMVASVDAQLEDAGERLTEV